MTSDDLEPLEPAVAVEMYLDERRSELSEKSIQNHKYRLKEFVEYCAHNDIENLNCLTGRDLHHFRHWRSGDVNTVTLRTHLSTLRVFLEFCARIDAVEEGMREKVMLPELKNGEDAREVQLGVDRARAVLEHLDRYEYASRSHVIVAIRLGTLRAFDVEDFDAEGGALEVRHRPEEDTRLKNGQAAERSIAVGPYFEQVIGEYIQNSRHPVEDDYGRKPLITSRYGRLSESPIRETIYKFTRPCVTGSCPHDRDPDTCEAMNPKRASECPSSRSPHGVRRGSITHHLREGTPEEVVSDRMNVSSEVLERHYDQRTEGEKREVRREFLSKMWEADSNV